MLVLCLLVLNNLIYYYSGFEGQGKLSDYFFWDPILLLGPLSYFYCRSLFDANFQMTRSRYLQLLPVIIDLALPVASVTIWALISFSSFELQQDLWVRRLDQYDTYHVVPGCISLVGYLIGSWVYIRRSKTVADSRTYRWSREFILGLSIVAGLWLPFVALYISPSQSLLLEAVYFFPVFFPVVIFIYFLSIRLMATRLSFRQNLLSPDELLKNARHLEATVGKSSVYRDRHLTLKTLSQEAGLPQKVTSFIINHHYKKGFNQFVNEIRVAEAIRKINTSEYNNLTIEGIANEVGFASRSTFYRAFKQVTGEDPGSYLKL